MHHSPSQLIIWQQTYSPFMIVSCRITRRQYMMCTTVPCTSYMFYSVRFHIGSTNKPTDRPTKPFFRRPGPPASRSAQQSSKVSYGFLLRQFKKALLKRSWHSIHGHPTPAMSLPFHAASRHCFRNSSASLPWRTASSAWAACAYENGNTMGRVRLIISQPQKMEAYIGCVWICLLFQIVSLNRSIFNLLFDMGLCQGTCACAAACAAAWMRHLGDAHLQIWIHQMHGW